MARSREIDLSSFIGLGCDEIVRGISLAANHAQATGIWSPATAITVLNNVRADLIPWLAEASAASGQPVCFADMNMVLLEKYACHLKAQKKFTTAAQNFDQIISLLHATASLGLSAPVGEIKPQNLFPNRVAAQQATKPFSRVERRKLLLALTEDLSTIREGQFEVIPLADAIVVYYQLIAFRTGFNPSALLEISRDALKDHPLRPGYKILVSFKARGMREVSIPTRWSDDVQEFRVCGAEVATLYRELLELTQGLSNELNGCDRAFIRPPLAGTPRSSTDRKPIALTNQDVSNAIHRRISPRHALIGDDGQPLRPTGRRLRVTLAARVFELSEGDPFVVAKILNNAPKVTSIHYLSPPAEALPDFHAAMESLIAKLATPLPVTVTPTPIGGCSDPLFGKYAPGDGVTYCERWLNCFKCPHQCITGEADDLWRLYSFYWLLQENSKRLRRMPIAGLFRFVVHALEHTVMERYGAQAKSAMQRARSKPHPFWAQAKNLEWLHA